jgi:hypothetical protein
MKKVSIVGAGNGGIFTALFFSRFKQEYEVELIYDSEVPPEPVGQATLLESPRLLWDTIGYNWYNNSIHATMKSGILYEGWGKLNDKVFHDFPANCMAMHYCPWEMHNAVLKSGYFKVVEDRIDPKDIDADYVFDCRGKPKDFSDYEELINPNNSCLLGKPNWDTAKDLWSRHVATPNGWTFVIPTNSNSPSHDYCVGYCYNSNITSRKDVENNMLEMFDVEITKHINFKNYVAKNPVIDDRIILNGNRLFFLEPMESSSTQTYIEVAKFVYNFGLKNFSTKVKEYIKRTQNFILWHYQYGSKYNTPYWDYVKSLKFYDPRFYDILRDTVNMDWDRIKMDLYNDPTPFYGQWNYHAFKVWYNGMTKKEK